MTLDEKLLREALSAVIRGAILLVVLTIIRALAFKLPGIDAMIGNLNAGGYIYVATSAIIIGVLVKMFAPLKQLVAYYLTAAATIGKVPGREQYLPYVVPLSATIVAFVYIILIYNYLDPRSRSSTSRSSTGTGSIARWVSPRLGPASSA